VPVFVLPRAIKNSESSFSPLLVELRKDLFGQSRWSAVSEAVRVRVKVWVMVGYMVDIEKRFVKDHIHIHLRV
jgi:hypothetical protein